MAEQQSSSPSSQSTVLCVSRLDSCVGTLLQSNFDADTKTFLTTLLKIIDNILSKPYDQKVRQLRVENAAIKSKLLSRKGGLEVLLACGFVQEATPPPLLSKTIAVGEQLLVFHHEDVSFLRTARRLLVTRAVQELGIPTDQIPVEPPKVHVAASTTNPGSATTAANFNVYSGHRYDAASAALGMQVAPDAQYVSKTETALKALTKKQAQLERQLQQSVENRQWKASRPGEATQPSIAAASFTTEQQSAAGGKTDSSLLAARMQAQQKERQRQEAGFTTHAMREVERLKKARVYSHTVLTLQFDDGYKVTGCFLPGETVGQVQQALKDDCFVQSLEFDLVVTPPRRVLILEQTLQQEGLVPAAKVIVSWKSIPAQRGQAPGWYLQPHLLTHSESLSAPAFPESKPVAESIRDDSKPDAAAAAAVQQPPAESREDALLRRMMGGGRKLGLSSSSSTSGASTAGADATKPNDKKPKWFKS